MAWTEEQRETFRRRFKAIWEGIRVLPVPMKPCLVGITTDRFVEDMESLLEPRKFHRNTVTRWKRADTIPRPYQRAALVKLLRSYGWSGKRKFELLIDTLHKPEFPEKRWRMLFQECWPDLYIKEVAANGEPVVKRRVTTGLRYHSFASAPAEIQGDSVNLLADRIGLVEKVLSAMAFPLDAQQADLLRSYLHRVPTPVLRVMAESGGCEPWIGLESTR